jgi:hypothetical protein
MASEDARREEAARKKVDAEIGWAKRLDQMDSME